MASADRAQRDLCLLEQIDCDTVVSHKRHRIVYQMFI